MDRLDGIHQRMTNYRPRKKWWRFIAKRSAVAVILRQQSHGVEALMIKRAEHENDPWSGQMAFPGGRLEPSDPSSLATARRETLEEIGFDTHQHCDLLGRLSDVQARTRHGRQAMIVSPFLFQANHVPELILDETEVADVIWVPLKHIADASNREMMDWDFRGKPIILPCYYFQEQRIWGLSLTMLDELVEMFRK